jgi:hypothetical protein
MLPAGERVRCTFSAGLAAIGKDAQNVDGLIQEADNALYRAKGAGRNRVISAGDAIEAIDEKQGTEKSFPVKKMSITPPGKEKVQQPHVQGEPLEQPIRPVKAIKPGEIKLPTKIDNSQKPLELKKVQKTRPDIDLKTVSKQTGFPLIHNDKSKLKNILIFHGNHGGGVTSVILAAARTLCLHHEVAVIDADFRYPDIGLKTGIPAGMIPPMDWRIGGINAAVGTGGFYVFPMDPTVSVNSDKLGDVVREAVNLVGASGFVLIDAGNNRLNINGTVVAISGPGKVVNGDLVIINKADSSYRVGAKNVIGVIPYEAEAVVKLKAAEIFKSLFAKNGKGAKKSWTLK